MSDRYLAILDATGRGGLSAAEMQRRTGLAHCLDAGRWAIYSSDPGLCRLSPDGCAVLGSIFERYGPPRRPDRIEGDLLTQAGDWAPTLLSRYWGNYVALADAPAASSVLRAPLGALPCYYQQCDGMIVIASDPLLLKHSGLWKGAVDWQAIASSLYFRDYPGAGTALAGVTEILGGQAVCFSDAGIEARYLWSPWDHVNAAELASEQDVTDAVRRTIENCVAAQASEHERIMVTVSGGLDSSVVASSLSANGRAITGLTMATAEPSGDERPFARALCAHRGIDLIEQQYDLADVHLGRSVSRFSARPTGRIHEGAFRAAVGRSVSDLGCTAVFSGNGGDNVLYNSASARPLTDRFLTEGLSRGLLRTASDIARLTGSPVTTVVAEAARVGIRERKRYRWRVEQDLLPRDVVAVLEGQGAPSSWLDRVRNATPAKLGHVAMVMRMLRHIEGYERDWPFTVLNPLGSQPIVELMLSLPAWRFCEHGTDRSVVRRAFATKLPAAIVDRRIKLGPDAFIINLINAKVREIRERLMDGTLAAQGIVDRSAVSAMLAPEMRARPHNYMRIMAVLDAEAWTKEWEVR